MHERFLIRAAALLAVAAGSGCTATSTSDPAPVAQAREKGTEKDDVDPAAEAGSLERKIEIARQRLRKAELELAAAELAQAEKQRRAEAERLMAESRLKQLVALDQPARLAQARLNLQRVMDRAQEAADELKQIEIMYADSELDDKTAEFVVSRGRRNAERQAQQIEIERQQLESLEQHALPMELMKTELEARQKAVALEELARERETELLGKRIAVMSAEADLSKAEQDLAAFRKKQERKQQEPRS